MVLAPKLLSYLPGLANNPDIPRYTRPTRIGRWSWAGTTASALLIVDRAGSRFDRNSVELDLTVPVRIRPLDFASFFIVQWFGGYGETIRDSQSQHVSAAGGHRAGPMTNRTRT